MRRWSQHQNHLLKSVTSARIYRETCAARGDKNVTMRTGELQEMNALEERGGQATRDNKKSQEMSQVLHRRRKEGDIKKNKLAAERAREKVRAAKNGERTTGRRRLPR